MSYPSQPQAGEGTPFNQDSGYNPSQPVPPYPGYPPQQPGYPPQQPGYPPQQLGYPPQQPGYPPQQPGYPPQQPGYPPQQSGYPPQQPGYPPQQPGYPPQQPVVNQPGFPQFPGQPGFNPGAIMPVKPMDLADQEGVMVEVGEDGENPFSDKAVRRAFIRKVYLILTAQLLVTFGFVFVCTLNDVKYWIIRHKEVYYTSYGVFMVTFFMLSCPCCKGIRRKWPWNFICLLLLTLAMAYMTGTITAFYQTRIVLMAVGISAGVCLVISVFAIQTKIDFTLCRGCLCVFSLIFVIFGIATLIIGIKYGFNETLDLVYACLGSLLFAMYLLVDTQMIVGGDNRKHQISPEEYIYAALQLYLDMVQLFLMILRIVGSKKVAG